MTNLPLSARVPVRAFTLIELLVVVSIGVMLIALSVPALSALNASSFSSAVNDVQTTLELAHDQAVARNTYVWVGFNQVNATDLAVVVVASVNGENDYTASNLRPVLKPNLKSSLRLLASPDVTAEETTLSAGDMTFQQKITTVSATPLTFSPALAFTPRGEVLVLQNANSNWIRFDLQRASSSLKSVASFKINGVNGRTVVERNESSQQ